MDVISRPGLSIIVPVLNEAESLPGFLEGLAAQQRVAFEVLVCDGGSADGSRELISAGGRHRPFPVVWVESPPGRAVQLNRGAARARGELLLFLHVDCRFEAADALARGVAALREARRQSPEIPVAGHFSLRFDLPAASRDPLYDFYELKASSGLRGTIHGDQGFLLAADDFRDCGPFPEQPPLLEDTRFADRLLAGGRWILLPARIVTSARRFQIEGLRARQTLNALVMNFAAIGWDDFFRQAPDLYRRQDRTAPLDLLPYFRLVRRLLGGMPRRERWRLWVATGAYVRSQGWQLRLLLALRARRFAVADPAAELAPRLAAWGRWWDSLTDHPAGRLAGTLLVRCWFSLTQARLERCDRVRARRLP